MIDSSKRASVVIWLSLVIFILSFGLGLWMSGQKLLWNDELYTQVQSIEMTTYPAMLKGKIGEGNVTPVFYLIQKTICRLAGYKFPLEWKHEWFLEHKPSQILLRLNPNFFTSLMLAAIFYFFARTYSLWAGVYGVLVALSYPMIWAYWVEARPYPLWICFTALHSLYFIYLMRRDVFTKKMFWQLVALHHLLCLTIVFGLAQVMIVSLLLFITRERDWKKYLLLVASPAVLSIFYFSQSPKYKFWFATHPLNIILPNMPLEWFILIGLFIIILIAGQTKRGAAFLNNKMAFEARVFMFYFALILVAGFSLLGLFVISASTPPDGFSLNSRYFLFLNPVEIVGVVLFSVCLLDVFRDNRWMKINLIITFAGILVIRLMHTAAEIYASGTYIHF